MDLLLQDARYALMPMRLSNEMAVVAVEADSHAGQFWIKDETETVRTRFAGNWRWSGGRDKN